MYVYIYIYIYTYVYICTHISITLVQLITVIHDTNIWVCVERGGTLTALKFQCGQRNSLSELFL